MRLDDKKCALYVEGPNDGSVVNNLVKILLQVDISRTGTRIIKVRPEGGGYGWASEQLLDALDVRSFRAVGLVVDRDGLDEKPDRWPSIRDRLRNRNIQVPDEPARDGFLADVTPSLRVGVWLMPDNTAVGDLESFLEQMVAPERVDWPYAMVATREARTRGAEYRTVDERKARMHTWLSWRENPGHPYGLAMAARSLLPTSPAAVTFAAWFKHLYLDDAQTPSSSSMHALS